MAQTVIPTVPTFSTGDHSLTNLENLASCVRFLVGDIRPDWHLYKTATQSITASTWTTLTFGSTAYDSEASGAGNTGICTDGTGATIRTQGLYAVEACANFRGLATTGPYCEMCFLMTGGGNNPNLSSGSTIRFGLRGNQGPASTTQEAAICIGDTTPICAYPLDTIRVQVQVNLATTVQPNNNTAYNEGRFAMSFTGHWTRVWS